MSVQRAQQNITNIPNPETKGSSKVLGVVSGGQLPSSDLESRRHQTYIVQLMPKRQ